MSKTTSKLNSSTVGRHREIAASLNRALIDRELIARVSQVGTQMTIFIEGSVLPQQASLCAVIYKGLSDLNDRSIADVKVYGRQTDDPNASWKTEFSFPTSSSQAIQPIAIPDYSAQLKAAVEQSFTFISLLLSNRRIQIGLAGIVALSLLTLSSMKGANVIRDRLAQRSIIQTAEETIHESKALSGTSLEEMKEMASDLRRSRSDLRNIPNAFGSLYDTAQATLPEVDAELNKLDQAIAQQEEAAAAFEEAVAAAEDAMRSVSMPSHAVAEWSDARSNLQSAIDQLSAIPQETLLAESIAAKLTEYKTQLERLDTRLKAEQAATASLDKAHMLATQAYNEARLLSADTADLQRSQQLWTQAVSQIRSVPNTSYAYRYVERRLQAYQSNLNNTVSEIKNMQECLERSKSFSFNICTLGYVSLENPEYID